MSRKNIIKIFKKYQTDSVKKHREYFCLFEEKMLYRTTKTENPQTTREMVRQVLNKVETTEGRKKYVNALKDADGGNLKLLERLIKIAIQETTKELSL